MRRAVVRKGTDDDTKFFLNHVMQKTGLNEFDAEMAVDVMIAAIPRALKNGDSMKFSEIGTFSVEYKPHQESPGSKHYRIVKFEPTGEMKDIAGQCRLNA
ncbi:MAG: HU family DNA-binding protein [Oceanidesulfovibrio sp.]